MPPSEMWQALPDWIDAADNANELQIALRLSEVAAAHEPQDVEQAARHARLLLLQDRPDEALQVLREAGADLSRRDLPASWADAVALASQAACGDREAFRWLLQAAAQSSGRPWHLHQLIAAAAEQLGDWPTADRIWLQMWNEGVQTRLTLGHAVVALLAARHDNPRRAAIVVHCAELLDESVQQHDEAMLEAVVARLRGRGDEPGARLLLAAVRAWNHRDATAERLAGELEPAAMRGYRWRVTLLSLLIIPALAATGLGLVLFWAGAHTWRHKVRVPGFDLGDSIAWRDLRGQRRNPGGYRPRTAREMNSYSLLGAVLGFCIGIVLAVASTSLLALVVDVDTLGTGATTFYLITMVGMLLVPAIIGVHAAHRIAAWRLARATRRAQQADLGYRARACSCWESVAMTGPLAAAYLHEHLFVRPLAPEAAARLAQVPGATTATCHATATTWLAVTSVDDSRRTLLLRGPATAPPSESTDVGFYL